MPKKKLTTQKSELPFPSLSREELENLLSDLYVKFDNVRNFIDLRMTGDSRTLVNKYKKLIKNRLIEDIEEGTNGLDEALRAIRDFALHGPAPHDQADVMLFFVEIAVNCINEFGDLYEEFYDEADDVYQETLEFMKKHKLLNDFQTRCKKIVDESVDTGYGFHDSLGDTYYTYFPEGKIERKTILVKKQVPMKQVKKSSPLRAGNSEL